MNNTTNDLERLSASDLFGMLARFFRQVGGSKSYIVRGWYLDANGCPKTYGNGYEESFTDETQYLPNDQAEPLHGRGNAQPEKQDAES